jgi:hypothetical protein
LASGEARTLAKKSVKKTVLRRRIPAVCRKPPPPERAGYGGASSGTPDILCTVSARDLEQIPEHGPLVIIANHPTGTLDGLALMYAVSRVRRDVKVVTNRMLTHLEPLSSLFIPVDNMGGKTAKTSLVQMEQHLQNAGVLIFFPAGEVSAPRAKAFAIKNGTLALSNLPANCAPPATGTYSGA